MKIYQQEERKAESKGIFLSAYHPPPAPRGWPCCTLRCFERTGSIAHGNALVNGKQLVLRGDIQTSLDIVLIVLLASAFPCWLI